MRESTIEKYLVAQVKAIGGEVRKVQWVGRNGAPDRIVMLPSREQETSVTSSGIKYTSWSLVEARTIWVELKAPGKAPESHQLREHKRMRDVGQTVIVIDSIEGVDELLRGYK